MYNCFAKIIVTDRIWTNSNGQDKNYTESPEYDFKNRTKFVVSAVFDIGCLFGQLTEGVVAIS